MATTSCSFPMIHRLLLVRHHCSNTKHLKIHRNNFKYNYSINRHLHSTQNSNQCLLSKNIKVNALLRDKRSNLSIMTINRLLSNNFSITWKKKTVRSQTTELQEREKVAHLVIDRSLNSPPIKMNLTNNEIKSILLCLNKNKEIEQLAQNNGIDKNTLLQSFISFRKVCFEAKLLPTDLYLKIEDLKKGSITAVDLFPYLLKQAQKIFPHLLVIDELKQISDMTAPEHMYVEARQKQRKIIFHTGPTNSGKTHHAMNRFLEVDSAIYLSPLRLLAMEVYHKSNSAGVPCDLVTGEERRSGYSDLLYLHEECNSVNQEASHLACTAEMIQLEKSFNVAIIDEIQTIRSKSRGWAWTRALLGLNCEEIHVCGESSAINIVQKIADKCGDEFQIKEYERLTPLEVEDSPLISLEDLSAGDCIVCFSRHKIMDLSKEIQNLGHEVAIIYGNLPPATKLSMAKKFNDPNDPCKILIATDAIGMGLNLNIRRIIFDNLKTSTTFDGMKNVEEIDASSVLQIAGRAGRYGTQWEKGFVTTRRNEDLFKLKEVMKMKPKIIQQAGIQPELEVYELFAYYMPNYSFQHLLDLSNNLCKIDESLYFFSKNENLKVVSEKLQHIPLDVRQRYTLSYSPISITQLFENQMFLKFARHIAEKQIVTVGWLSQEIKWPVTPPVTSNQLYYIESIYNVLELYCWLSYNYPYIFIDSDEVREMKTILEKIILDAVNSYPGLIENNKGESDADSTETDFKSEKEEIRDMEIKDLDSHSDSKASEKLIKMGLLTPVILQQLKQEWEMKSQVAVDDDEGDEVFPVEDEPLKKSNDDVTLVPQAIEHSTSSQCKDASVILEKCEEDKTNSNRLFINDICHHLHTKPTFQVKEQFSNGNKYYTCTVVATKYSGEGHGESIEAAENNAISALMNKMETESRLIFGEDLELEDQTSAIEVQLRNEEIYNIYKNMNSSEKTENTTLPKTNITQLYELCAKAKVSKPKIELILAEPFPDSSWNFKFSIQTAKYNAIGEGPTKKIAKEAAAKSLLNLIENDCLSSTENNYLKSQPNAKTRNNEDFDSTTSHQNENTGNTKPREIPPTDENYYIQHAMMKLKKGIQMDKNIKNLNPVSNLTVLCAKAKLNAPKFTHLNTRLLNKQYHYTYNVSAVHLSAQGAGSSKSKAKLAAAQALLDSIERLAILESTSMNRMEVENEELIKCD